MAQEEIKRGITRKGSLLIFLIVLYTERAEVFDLRLLLN